MKITDKLRDGTIEPYFSFEFFPPKTEAGVENLYLRMDRMTSLQPLFVDVTWGAGGCTKELTMAICEYSQTYFGVDALMHLTCTNLTVEEIKLILKTARDMGIQNILALRGDPAKGSISWEPYPGGCENAIDLVKLIRKEHGDYFCIGVAGFPEGHPYSTGDSNQDLQHLKNKIDAGADFILTQFFYDSSVFLNFRDRCLAEGITCPIIPGMMPLQSYSSFYRMTKFCKTKVPEQIWIDLEPIRDDDEQVKLYGVKLCTEMCENLRQNGIKGFHFYTLNLEQSVTMVLNNLGVQDSLPLRRYVCLCNLLQIYSYSLAIIFVFLYVERFLGADLVPISTVWPKKSAPSTGRTAPNPTSNALFTGTNSPMVGGETTVLLHTAICPIHIFSVLWKERKKICGLFGAKHPLSPAMYTRSLPCTLRARSPSFPGANPPCKQRPLRLPILCLG